MKRRLPPLNALRAFEAAGRLGRMTAAADELAVTPGAISRQVRQLEDALGVLLFDGPKQRPALTEAGRLLLPPLSDAFDRIEAVVRAVADEPAGTLDVSCFSTFTLRWLFPRLYRLQAVHPEIDVRLSTADRAVSVERERFDVVITLDDEAPAASGRIVVEALFPEWLGPVLAPSLAASIRLRAPADLRGAQLLRTRTRPDAWVQWATRAGCPAPKPGGQLFEHYEFTLQAAAAGLGICIAPWHLVVDDLAAGRLVAPLGFCESGHRYVALRRAQRSVKAERFCAWLLREAAAMPLPR
ncbi:LysR family transcriptional regulator [Aquincola sp. S2]|uniref:LysR family transcriptional regulator n=1 Tax=Pseudaquabacterium terrae TaxID=2732868 RepID=A0ABX2EJF5_9BURK|nr:LysR substrate-binding domain-containing protein [Aquabacterium terrae]NRF68781.1 LysR family transcriptional regulator [Aquabacterium terrae]